MDMNGQRRCLGFTFGRLVSRSSRAGPEMGGFCLHCNQAASRCILGGVLLLHSVRSAVLELLNAQRI